MTAFGSSYGVQLETQLLATVRRYSGYFNCPFTGRGTFRNTVDMFILEQQCAPIHSSRDDCT